MQAIFSTGSCQLPIIRQAGGIWYPSLPVPLKPIDAIPAGRADAPAKASPRHRIIRRIFHCVVRELTTISTNPIFRLFGGVLILTSHEPLAEMLLRGVVVFVCLRATMHVYTTVHRGLILAFSNLKKELGRVWSMVVRKNRAYVEDVE